MLPNSIGTAPTELTHAMRRCHRRTAAMFANHLALNQIRHNPLWLGWDEAQIEKAMVEMNWRDEARGPVLAALACSLAADAMTTSNPIRYSRRKAWYAYFARHIDEPAMSYRKIVGAMDVLKEEGWAEDVLGVHAMNGQGKQSIAWATPALIERLASSIVLEQRRAPEPEDVLVLRDKDRRSLPVPDTEATRSMRDDLDILNAAYAAQEWYLWGRQLDIPVLRRIFNQTMARGGRGYHHGASYQQLPAEERAHITIDVNGIMWPTKEVDFSTLHIRFAYADAGVPMPSGDAYEVPGFDRNREVKPALNTLMNAATENEALGVIGGLLDDDWNRGRELIAALKAKHEPLVGHFGKDAGARFQRLDSDIAITVALAVLRRTGRPPLLVHDSFLVAACDKEALRAEMSVALEASLPNPLERPTLHAPPDVPQPPGSPLPPSSLPYGEPPLLSRREVEPHKTHRSRLKAPAQPLSDQGMRRGETCQRKRGHTPGKPDEEACRSTQAPVSTPTPNEALATH